MLNSKEGFDATVSISEEIFPLSSRGHREVEYKDGKGSMYFFTEEERAEIRSKIREYELNPKSRSGGSALSKKIENIANAKKELLRFIRDVHDMLEPRERSRVSVKEAEALAEQRSINSTAESYRKAFPEEKMLRNFATSILGDVQGDYTVQELPLVIATKQITDTLMSIS